MAATAEVTPASAGAQVSREVIRTGLCLVEAGLSDGASGNISTRCPGGSMMLITPSARDFRLLRERDLLRLDLVSGAVEGRWRPSSEWRLHTAIYAARPDAAAIIHHHGTWASAVAVARKTIPVLIDEAADIGPIPTAAYAPSASQELAEAAARELAKGSNAILLANHGAVVVGRNLREALRRAFEVERLAKIYIGAEVLGGAHALDDDAILRSSGFFETYRAPMDGPPLEPAMPGVAGPVGLSDLVCYSFRASITFMSLVHALIQRKLGGERIQRVSHSARDGE